MPAKGRCCIMRRKSNIPILIITSLITFLVVTIIDLMTPLGYSQWLLYIFPLLIIYISEKPGLIYLHLVLIAFALLIGYIYSPIHPTYENIRDISKLNRIEGFFVFLTFSIIINKLINSRIHFRKLSGELAYANSELESFFEVYFQAFAIRLLRANLIRLRSAFAFIPLSI